MTEKEFYEMDLKGQIKTIMSVKCVRDSIIKEKKKKKNAK